MSIMIRLVLLVCLSIAGGVVAALVFAVSIGPDAGVRALMLPAVAQIASFVGGMVGLLISPLMVWAFHDKKLWVAVPCIYGFACIAIIVLNVLSVRFSELIAIGITIAALFLYGLFGKRHHRPEYSDDSI